MAKVAFSKLGIKKVNDKVKNITFNDIEIEVKQYLPIQDKLIIIGNAINNAADNNRFANPIKIDMYLALEIIMAYTDISFTDKQKEDMTKLYDLFVSSGLLNEIYAAIPEDELNMLHYNSVRIAESMYNQMNSAYGIMENIANDYSGLEFDATKIQETLKDENTLPFLKDVMNKLG